MHVRVRGCFEPIIYARSIGTRAIGICRSLHPIHYHHNMCADNTSLYAASCNPSRRAKRPRTDSLTNTADPSVPSFSTSMTLLPKLRPREHHVDVSSSSSSTDATRTPTTATTTTTTTTTATTIASPDTPAPAPAPPPSKLNTRKPNSRAAREAQRKLNHSIIEKVRRTKINDALAMLRSIVPVDYGTQKHHHHPNGRAEYGDDDDEESGGGGGSEEDVQRKRRKAGTGRKEEKGKEYKLEILVRTVAFVQDLLEKVKVMEDDRRGEIVGECVHCGFRLSSSSPSPEQDRRKRKRTDDDDGDEGRDVRTTSVSTSTTISSNQEEDSLGSHNRPPSSPFTRLPPISSWLPLTHVDPSALTHSGRSNYYHLLPSPPSSAFVLAKPTKLPHPPPPAFSLGPSSSSPSSRKPMTITTMTAPPSGFVSRPSYPLSPLMRTPEDKSAASLLLQIRNSPPSLSLVRGSTSVSSSIKLPEAAKRSASSSTSTEPQKDNNNDDGVVVVVSARQAGVLSAHTPSTLLGLRRT